MVASIFVNAFEIACFANKGLVINFYYIYCSLIYSKSIVMKLLNQILTVKLEPSLFLQLVVQTYFMRDII